VGICLARDTESKKLLTAKAQKRKDRKIFLHLPTVNTELIAFFMPLRLRGEIHAALASTLNTYRFRKSARF